MRHGTALPLMRAASGERAQQADALTSLHITCVTRPIKGPIFPLLEAFEVLYSRRHVLPVRSRSSSCPVDSS